MPPSQTMKTTEKTNQTVRPRKCLDCGADISSTHCHTLRCAKCHHVHNLALKRASRKRCAASHKAQTSDRRCPYCGKPARRDSTYCTRCLNEGFAEVHKMFGSTNGWDKKLRTRTRVPVGNRGVIPSGAVNFTKSFTLFSTHNGKI